ncbi:MAG: GEVED domain-containing protein [Ignavibacteriae bacterium]|nr:GEVED domain-containing protein [Ignavibacteriota bacterium]
MKKKFLSVLLPLFLLFIVTSGFVPFSIFRGIESPIFLQSKLLLAPQQEAPKVQTPGMFNGIPLPKGGEIDAVSGYTFSQSTTTYTPSFGGTLICATSCDDGYISGVALPFTFTYNGAPFTTISISHNGWACLGTQTPSGYTPICTGTYTNILSPFAGDLMGYATGDSLRYLTTGTTPNRVFTVEWYKWGIYNAGTSVNEFDFQLKLYETTNIIQFVYKPETPTLSYSITVGISGTTNADYNLRTTTTSWASTTAASTVCSYCSYSSSIYPANGLTFTWTPPVVASGNMGYVSSNTIKLNPGTPYMPATLNNQIVQVQIADTGALNPISINRIKFGTGGSNNPSVDIANAKVWYTRSSSTFAVTRQYGTSIPTPNGVMNFTDTATLDPNATNYFWLTYDLSPSAVSGDSVTARCDSIIGSSPMGGQVPSTVAPSGANPIDPYCFGTYTNVGLPYGIYITNVNFGSINNTSGCPGTLPYVYSNYTNLSTVVRQSNPYPMIVINQNVGNPNPTAFGVWIDWNNNNSMLDPGEWYPTTVIPANTTTVATATINVPSSATLGAHRMRIRANLSTAPLQATICALLSYGEQEDYTVIVAADTNMTYHRQLTNIY